MFSLLSMINGWIGYINMNAKVKNRVYTVLGGLGNFYLLYVAYRFYANGFAGRGTLFILAFLILLYFTYLNVMYFFTDQPAKFDISPVIMQWLHITPKDPEEEARKKVARARAFYQQHGYVQTNGIFKNENLLPATLTFSPKQEANIQQLVQQLATIQYLNLDYGGRTDDDIYQELKTKTQGQVYALADPVALPYFNLKNTGDRLEVYGGLNQMESQSLATITEIGLMPATQALTKYRLSIATAVVAGGPFKRGGRSSVMEEHQPFTLKVQLAYQEKAAVATAPIAPPSSQPEPSKTNSSSDQPLRRTQHTDAEWKDSSDQPNSPEHYSRTERYHR